MTDDKPLRISWSRIRLHSECPQKGYLTSLGKRARTADGRVFFPGTVTDRCMRQFLSLEVQEKGWMAAQVARIMDEEEAATQANGDGTVKWKTLSDREEVRRLCTDAVTQLEDDLDALLGLSWQSPERRCTWDAAPRFEAPLTIPHPDGRQVQIILIGEIDLRVYRPEGWSSPPGTEIWDLKTTRDNSYWRKTLGQLALYEVSEFIRSKGKWPVRSGLLQPLCDDTAPSWTFTMQNRTDIMNRIVSVAGDIFTGRLDPTPSTSKCRYCDVRHACPVKGGGRGRAPLGVTGP